MTTAYVEETASLITNVDYIHIQIQLSQFTCHTPHFKQDVSLRGSPSHLVPQVPVFCPGWSAVSALDSTAWYMNG